MPVTLLYWAHHASSACFHLVLTDGSVDHASLQGPVSPSSTTADERRHFVFGTPTSRTSSSASVSSPGTTPAPQATALPVGMTSVRDAKGKKIRSHRASIALEAKLVEESRQKEAKVEPEDDGRHWWTLGRHADSDPKKQSRSGTPVNLHAVTHKLSFSSAASEPSSKEDISAPYSAYPDLELLHPPTVLPSSAPRGKKSSSSSFPFRWIKKATESRSSVRARPTKTTDGDAYRVTRRSQSQSNPKLKLRVNRFWRRSGTQNTFDSSLSDGADPAHSVIGRLTARKPTDQPASDLFATDPSAQHSSGIAEPERPKSRLETVKERVLSVGSNILGADPYRRDARTASQPAPLPHSSSSESPDVPPRPLTAPPATNFYFEYLPSEARRVPTPNKMPTFKGSELPKSSKSLAKRYFVRADMIQSKPPLQPLQTPPMSPGSNTPPRSTLLAAVKPMEIPNTPNMNTVAPFLEQDAEIERSENELGPAFVKVKMASEMLNGATTVRARKDSGARKLRKRTFPRASKRGLLVVDEESDSSWENSGNYQEETPMNIPETVPEIGPEGRPKKNAKGYGRGSIIKWLGATASPSENWSPEMSHKPIEVQEAEKKRELRDTGVIGLAPEQPKDESDSDDMYTYAAAIREIAGLSKRPEGASSKKLEKILPEFDGDVPTLSLDVGSSQSKSPATKSVRSVPEERLVESGHRINRSLSNPERRVRLPVVSREYLHTHDSPSPERTWVSRFQSQSPYQPPAESHGVQKRMDDVFTVHEISSNTTVEMALEKHNSPVSHTVSPDSPYFPRTPFASRNSPRVLPVFQWKRPQDQVQEQNELQREDHEQREEANEEDKDWVKC